MTQREQQYGTWSSPISPKALASSLSLSDIQWDTASDTLVWHEGRGAQGVLVMQRGSQAPRDLTSDLSVRARVGYGGGDFAVAGGQVYFAGPDGRLYRQGLEVGSASPITPAFGVAAAPAVSPDGKWIIYVYSYEGQDGLALVDTDGKMWPRKFISGTDFVMQPRWNPKGTHLAYIVWNHPNMPWDGTELRLVKLEYWNDGVPAAAANTLIAGDANTAIFQPEFSPDGRYLAYVSDKAGWNQLYVYDLTEQTHTAITTDEADYGLPGWIQGMRTYGWTADSRSLVTIRGEGGISSLWQYNVEVGSGSRIRQLDHYTSMAQIALSRHSNRIALYATSAKIPARFISYDLDSGKVLPRLSPAESTSIEVIVGEPEGEIIHRRSSTEHIPQDQLAEIKPITWKGHDGEDVHGLYLPPTSTQFSGVGAPPLLLDIHGGPTAQRTAGYSGAAQFFATRGYAVLLVNYRGSTGYGRAYMNKLRESWGIYDVEDAAAGATHLAEQGLADPSRFIIMGGSAGGYTVLQSLVNKPGFYKAGVSLYGVSNMFALAADTHKFEERYLDSLLGPLPAAAALYRERSPIFHADKIVDPVAVFQGEDDVVVPRAQSDSIVASLKARGVPHIYHVYPGEGHGWRKPETIEHYLQALLTFLKEQVLFA